MRSRLGFSVFRKVVVHAAVLSAGLVSFAQASDLLPLQPGNKWRLANHGAEFVLTVEETVVSSGGTLARVHFQNPYAAYSWLLLDDASGIRLAGYALNGIESYLDEPTPLFPANGTTGQVWTGMYTKVTQTASNVRVTTPLGTFRNGVEFEVQYQDGSRQRWVLAPGTGFIAGGEKTFQLNLQSQTVKPAAAFIAPRLACVKSGIAAIPVDASLNTAAREAALAPALRAGGNLMSVSVAWNELEPSPGNYNTERVRDELAIAARNNMDVMLNIRPVDNIRDMRPGDLANSAWDSPAVVNRFAAAVDHLLAGLPPQVKWINIGYEVDPYFLGRPNDIAPFQRMFGVVKNMIRSKSTTSVGMVFSFDVLRTNSYAFRSFDPYLDHVGFNYYVLQTSQTFRHRPTNAPILDSLIMRNLARGRSIIMPEAGYASHSAVGGGPAAQAEFFQSLFTQLRSMPEAAAVNVWAMNDMPENLVRQAVADYGIAPMANSVEFMSSLGAVAVGGSPKPAMTTLKTEIATNLSVCTTH